MTQPVSEDAPVAALPPQVVLDYLSGPCGFGVAESVSTRLLQLPWTVLARGPLTQEDVHRMRQLIERNLVRRGAL